MLESTTGRAQHTENRGWRKTFFLYKLKHLHQTSLNLTGNLDYDYDDDDDDDDDDASTMNINISCRVIRTHIHIITCCLTMMMMTMMYQHEHQHFVSCHPHPYYPPLPHHMVIGKKKLDRISPFFCFFTSEHGKDNVSCYCRFYPSPFFSQKFYFFFL